MHLAPIDESIRPISASGTLPPKRDAWGLFLIIAGSLGLGFGLLISAVLAIFSLFGQQPIALGVEAAAFLALGLLGAPAIYWGAKGSAKRAERKPDRVWVLALLLYPLALFLGALAFEAGTLPRLLGPIAHILAAGAPVLFVVSISLSRGPLLSARRRWAHFLAGLWVTPPLALTIELISLVPLGLLMILGLALTPDGEALFRELLAVEIGSVVHEAARGEEWDVERLRWNRVSGLETGQLFLVLLAGLWRHAAQVDPLGERLDCSR